MEIDELPESLADLPKLKEYPGGWNSLYAPGMGKAQFFLTYHCMINHYGILQGMDTRKTLPRAVLARIYFRK
jgi:hypothetical protein